jgi:quercetin dioxygenase-like cupin family protein
MQFVRRRLSCSILLAGFALLFFSTSVAAQEAGEAAVVKKAATSKFASGPNTPNCVTVAVEKGDPATGPSVMLARFAPGCFVPWHWHTTNENVMVASGLLRIEMKGEEMKGEKPALLRSGDFALMPSHHVHQARCVGSAACLMFIYSDAAFDIHYVGKNDEEISLAEALKGSKKSNR